MPAITVHMLRIPSVAVEGVEITFPLRRADALLYYMICNKTATRKELVALLWESCDNETGHKNLRHTIYILKKCLGVDIVLSTQKTTIQINPDITLDCDYIRFMEQGDYSAFHGAFLDGFGIKNAFAYEDWVDRMRDRVRNQYMLCLYKLAQESANWGTVARAEQCAVSYLREDPLDEQMTVFLMELYRKHAMYPKVVHVYQQLHDNLEEELGIFPMDETTQLYYNILNEWNVTAAGKAETASGTAFIPQSREMLVHQIVGAAGRLQSGANPGPHLILLGKPGIGKTFVLEHALNRMVLHNVLLLRSICYQSDMQNDYCAWQPIMMIVAEYCLSEEICLPTTIHKHLAAVFPIFNQSESAHMPICEPSEDRIIENVLLLLYILLRHTKILVVIENLQWMDLASMRLLDAALRRFAAKPLLLIATGRNILPNDMEQCLLSATDDHLLSFIPIQPLTCEDVRRMVQDAYDSDTAFQVADRLREETGGNPQLLLELMRSVSKENPADQMLRLSQSILKNRLAHINTTARQLLDAVALFPGQAPCDIIGSVCEKDTAQLSIACSELTLGGFLAEQKSKSGVSTLSFCSEALQKDILSQQPFFRRQTQHAKIAEALKQKNSLLTTELCEQLNYHYTAAGDYKKALIYKAEHRWLLFMNSCAIRHGQRLTQPYQNEWKELDSDLAALRKLPAQDAAVKRAQAKILLVKYATALHLGYEEIAQSQIEQLIPMLTDLDADLFLCAYSQLCHRHQQLFHFGRLDQCIAVYTKQINSMDNLFIKSFFTWLRGDAYSQAGRYGESNFDFDSICNQSVVGQDSSLYRLMLAGAYHARGIHCQRQELLFDACRYYALAIDAMDSDHVSFLTRVSVDYGRAAMALGQIETARKQFERAILLGNPEMDGYAVVITQAYMAILLAEEESYRDALNFLMRAHELADRINAPVEQGVALYAKARLRRMADIGSITDVRLDGYLDQSCPVYCRRGLFYLSGIKGAVECEWLRECLKPENS